MGRYIPAWIAGGLIAMIAVAVGAFAVTNPPVYGFCVACHARDLAGGALNGFLGFDLPVTTGSADWPLLTALGLPIGAYLGARASGEGRQRPARRPVSAFLFGMAAMIFSLVAMGCTARLLLRAAYGDALSYWALGGAVAGVGGATAMLVWRARRGSE